MVRLAILFRLGLISISMYGLLIFACAAEVNYPVIIVPSQTYLLRSPFSTSVEQEPIVGKILLPRVITDSEALEVMTPPVLDPNAITVLTLNDEFLARNSSLIKRYNDLDILLTHYGMRGLTKFQILNLPWSYEVDLQLKAFSAALVSALRKSNIDPDHFLSDVRSLKGSTADAQSIIKKAQADIQSTADIGSDDVDRIILKASIYFDRESLSLNESFFYTSLFSWSLLDTEPNNLTLIKDGHIDFEINRDATSPETNLVRFCSYWRQVILQDLLNDDDNVFLEGLGPNVEEGKTGLISDCSNALAEIKTYQNSVISAFKEFQREIGVPGYSDISGVNTALTEAGVPNRYFGFLETYIPHAVASTRTSSPPSKEALRYFVTQGMGDNITWAGSYLRFHVERSEVRTQSSYFRLMPNVTFSTSGPISLSDLGLESPPNVTNPFKPLIQESALLLEPVIISMNSGYDDIQKAYEISRAVNVSALDVAEKSADLAASIRAKASNLFSTYLNQRKAISKGRIYVPEAAIVEAAFVHKGSQIKPGDKIAIVRPLFSYRAVLRSADLNDVSRLTPQTEVNFYLECDRPMPLTSDQVVSLYKDVDKTVVDKALKSIESEYLSKKMLHGTVLSSSLSSSERRTEIQFDLKDGFDRSMPISKEDVTKVKEVLPGDRAASIFNNTETAVEFALGPFERSDECNLRLE